MIHKTLKKRYWLFCSNDYEGSQGLDIDGTFDSLGEATKTGRTIHTDSFTIVDTYTRNEWCFRWREKRYTYYPYVDTKISLYSTHQMRTYWMRDKNEEVFHGNEPCKIKIIAV